MATRGGLCATLGCALLMTASAATFERAAGGDPRASAMRLAAGDQSSRFVPLGIGKSFVVDLPRDIKDVLVANPKIANAVVRSSRRAYLIGGEVGQTNIFFFDADGQQIAGFDIAVTRDLNGLRAAMRQILPRADIRVEGLGEGVMLAGMVANAGEAQQAHDLAARLVGDASKVLNSLTIQGRDQVMLKVTVAEMQRDVIKQLGIDLTGSVSYGAATVNFNTENPFSINGKAVNNTFGSLNLNNQVTATLRAMERAGVIRTLAEPNLTAISGESASFLAGGEFPIPAGYTCDPATNICQVSVQFKKFGVGLNFTPVVLAEGRISLRVTSEVSELTPENSLTLQQGQTSLTIPSVKTRRAETTVEIPSGGALAMAGMIQEQTKQSINSVPGLGQLPVLGALFRSRDYVNRQTELVVIVTPYVVRAVAPKELSRADDGFTDASDPATVLLGRINRIYGAAPADPRQAYRGRYGFILD
jgi:pilus assembly protein CpaC